MEARFAHLLQPIRDLTKNWEVDVAAQLGEYLEEVRAAPGEWRGAGAAGGRPPPGVYPSGALIALILRLVSFFPAPSLPLEIILY